MVNQTSCNPLDDRAALNPWNPGTNGLCWSDGQHTWSCTSISQQQKEIHNFTMCHMVMVIGTLRYVFFQMSSSYSHHYSTKKYHRTHLKCFFRNKGLVDMTPMSLAATDCWTGTIVNLCEHLLTSISHHLALSTVSPSCKPSFGYGSKFFTPNMAIYNGQLL